MLAFILLLFVQDAAAQTFRPPPPGPPATLARGERRLIDLGRVPAEGRAEDDFQPPGWRIEGAHRGDLDGDARPDTVLQLVEDLPSETSEGAPNERFRALLILLRRPDGSLARAAASATLLYCSTCGGALGDPAGGEVEIKNGVLTVSQLSGSRWANEHTWRFRRDPRTGRFLLIGEDLENYDRAEGSSTLTSTNYLTGVRVVKKTRAAAGGGERVLSNTRTRVRAAPRRLEDIDYEAQ